MNSLAGAHHPTSESSLSLWELSVGQTIHSRRLLIFLSTNSLRHLHWMSLSMRWRHYLVQGFSSASPFPFSSQFSLSFGQKNNLHRLLPGIPCCDEDNKLILSFEEYPRAADPVKLQKIQFTIQTHSCSRHSSLKLRRSFFQNTLGNLPLRHTVNNLIAITICGRLYFYEIPSLIHLLKEQPPSDRDVPCPQLSRITIHAVDFYPEPYSLGFRMLAKEPVSNPHLGKKAR